VIRRYQPRAGPALVDDVGQFPGDIDTPAVMPALLEPAGQFVAGDVFQHVDIQFALPGQSGQGEVAAADKAGDRVVDIPPEKQVELGMQRVAQVHLDRQLAGAELGG